MRGNFIVMAATMAAANAATTQLTANQYYATYADVFGLTGTRQVEYSMDDGLGHCEAGIGTINLATLVLTKSVPLETLDIGATPRVKATGATSLTTFAGPVTVRCAPLASAAGGGEVAHQPGTGYGVGNGYTNTQLDGYQSTTMQGWVNFVQFLWEGERPITSISCNVTTAGTGGLMRVGIMEVAAGNPDQLNLIAEFTVNTQFDLSKAGMQTINNFPPLALPKGVYVVQFNPATQAGNPKLAASGTHWRSRASLFGRYSGGAIRNGFMVWANGVNTLLTSTTCAANFSNNSSGPIYNTVPEFLLGMN